MRLKSLQMQGFKSFPDKIELSFDTGMTAVVGPNGSGKSNISDAVRWVLGEQSSKNLRGNKMEDIIFSGTKSRKASAFASVTLTINNFDRSLNVEEDEVSINRKLYRNGESEYKINGRLVRLKDVSELFMDTGLGKDGYSIISQGKIAEIVSAKSSERREIFEEASGISKFRYKKNEAEKKLILAEENMLRLNDIVLELENRLEPLKVQSEKAKQFIELSEKRKSIEVSVWLFKINDLRSTLNGLNERINIAQSQYDDLCIQVESSELKIQDGYIKMQESSIKVDDFQRKVSQLQQKLSESQSNVAVYDNDIQHANHRILELKQSKKSNANTKETLKSRVQDLEESIKNLEECLNDVTSQLTDLNDKLLSVDGRFGNINSELLEISSNINLIKHDIQKENLTLISMQTIIEETQFQLDSMETNNQEMRTLCDRYKVETIEVNSKFEECNDKNVKLNYQLSEYQSLLSDKESKLMVAKESYEKISLDLKERQHKVKLLVDLENSMEGFSKSSKLIMQSVSRGLLKGVYGLVAQLMETSKSYTTAIETALGSAMQNVIVQDEVTAHNCIRYLKSVNGGRSTFLPLTSIKSQSLFVDGIENECGFVGIASDLVSCKDSFNSIKSSLLGRIVVMDNLECATMTAKKYGYRFKIVTLDGQIVNAGGSFTGGSAVHSGGVFSRKSEIDDLNQELRRLSIEEKTLMDKVNSLRSEIESIHSKIAILNQQILESKSIGIQYQADLKRLNDTINQYESRLNSVDAQNSMLLSKKENSINRKTQSASRVKNLESQLSDLEKAYQSKEVDKNSLAEDRNSLLDEISKIKILQVEKSKDLETLKSILNKNKENISNLDFQSSNIDLEISNTENVISEKRQYIIDSQTLEVELIQKIENIKGEIVSWQDVHKQFEEQVTQVRLALRDLNFNKENLSRELIRLDEKKKTIERDYDNIISQLFDTYEMTFSEAECFATNIDDIQSAQRQLLELKMQMKSLGNVNVSAIDEYQEVLDRYTFLDSQLKDTRKSKAELEKLIQSLTRDMKTLFEENFYKINQNFKQIFIELFGGGSAELVLTNKDDILNSGIEILVSPPGKIIKSLISLSGGEQAFVSIAIYFAILKVKPSPFCILDEIDAPLDEVNVRKYAVYLNRFIDKTQFIVVTHRRGTMETANILYGVTMQKDGVSKLLKMEQKDIPTQNF